MAYLAIMNKSAIPISILLLLLAASRLTAQYLPLISENKYWIYAHYDNADESNINSGYLITIGGDTLVGDQLYRTVLRGGLSGSHPCPPWFQPCFVFDLPYHLLGLSVIGFIREDTVEKKVYYAPILNPAPCGPEEQLLLDFSLEVDDTLNTCAYNAVGGAAFEARGLIDSIQSVFLYGKTRRTLHTTGFTTYLGLWITGPIMIAEGVGYEKYGPFYYAGNLSLLVDYCEGTLDECNIISATGSPFPNAAPAVYPNPCTNSVCIEPAAGHTRIRLVDLHGHTRLEASTATEVDVSALPAGIYLVVLTGKDVAPGVARLIKL